MQNRHPSSRWWTSKVNWGRTDTKSYQLSRCQQKKHNQDQKTKERTNRSENKQTKNNQTTNKTKNEAKAFAPDEPWKWQWMLLHLNIHKETAKNVSSLSDCPKHRSLHHVRRKSNKLAWMKERSATQSQKRPASQQVPQEQRDQKTYTLQQSTDKCSVALSASTAATLKKQARNNFHARISTARACAPHRTPAACARWRRQGSWAKEKERWKQRARWNCYTLSMYTSDPVLLVDTSAEFFWVFFQLANVIDTISKRWQSKSLQYFTFPHLSLADSYSIPF